MSWITWPFRLAVFFLWFIKEVLVSNVRVLRDNLTPGQDSAPGIARLETRCSTDFELTLLGALITLTPGTLTLGTRTMPDERRILYVHGMYNDGPDDLREDLRDMESRMLIAVRRAEGGS